MVARVIVSQQMQDSVEYQPPNFVRGGVPFPEGVAPGRFRGDYNVAQEIGNFWKHPAPLKICRLCPPSSSGARTRRIRRHCEPALSRGAPGKREDIRGLCFAAITRVQAGHLPIPYKADIKVPPSKPQTLLKPSHKVADCVIVDADFVLPINDHGKSENGRNSQACEYPSRSEFCLQFFNHDSARPVP